MQFDAFLGAGLPTIEEDKKMDYGPAPKMDGDVGEGPKPWEADFWLVGDSKKSGVSG